MKRFLAGLAVLLALCVAPSASFADPPGYAVAVSACGTPGFTPVVGSPYPVTQDTTGKACVNATVAASVAVNPVTSTNASTTVTAGGTFQSVIASNSARNGCLVQNPVAATETLFVFFGANASATTAKSVSLSPGSAVSCAVGGIAVATDNVSVTATTTGHAFVVSYQ